jgi:[protein-PII] uridylyltransferase
MPSFTLGCAKRAFRAWSSGTATTSSRTSAEITRARHHKFGNTVFHLEPNVKDGPGGLRDYNVANWLALISAMEKLKVWPDAQTLLPVSSRRALDAALAFQMSVRCFLHFRHGRHDNTLTWEAQDEAAAHKIGASDAEISNAADWMRVYFGHVRSVHRVCNQLLDEIPAAWSSLYRQFQGWRSKVASDDFSVVDGLIFPAATAGPACAIRKCSCASFISWPNTASS